jgi:hypothetical protein
LARWIVGLQDWLEDAPEADWQLHILKLANRGDLGRATAKLLLDLPALAQPYGCMSGECTPGRRAPRIKSCCADLEVSVSADEEARIRGAMSEITAAMADDPRWPLDPVRDGALVRSEGRCVFAGLDPDGLRCRLHVLEDTTGRPRGALKPLPCRLFPLAIVDLGDGRQLLTAIHTRTARHLGSRSARSFPCLRDGARPPLWTHFRDDVVSIFGKRAWTGLSSAMSGYAAGDDRA